MITNYAKIKEMNKEDLAEFLCGHFICDLCPVFENCNLCGNSNNLSEWLGSDSRIFLFKDLEVGDKFRYKDNEYVKIKDCRVEELFCNTVELDTGKFLEFTDLQNVMKLN